MAEESLLLTQDEINSLLYGADRSAEDAQPKETMAERVRRYKQDRHDWRGMQWGDVGMNETICEIIKDALRKQKKGEYDYDAILEMYDRIKSFGWIARHEGLLSLEEAAEDFIREKGGEGIQSYQANYYYRGTFPCRPLTGVDRLFVLLIMCVVDGTDPDVIRELAVIRYYAGGYEGTEALLACAVIMGVLAIQAGEHPYLVRDKFLAIFPDEVENRLIDRERAEDDREGGQDSGEKRDAPVEIPDSFFEEEHSAGYPDGGSHIIGIAEEVLLRMDTDSLQKLAAWGYDGKLAGCLTVMGGKTRKRVFDNMVEWRRARTYSDIQYCLRQYGDGAPGAPDAKTVDAAEEDAFWLMKSIQRMEDNAEIVLRDAAAIRELMEELCAWHDHKIAVSNRGYEEEIRKRKLEIADLERRMKKS